MTVRATAAAAACLAALVGCRGSGETGAERPATAVVRELLAPAAPGSLAPSLSATRDGRALLSWIEPRPAGGHALRLAVRDRGGAWSVPVTVAEGDGWFVNWADFPHAAALDDGTFFAHWLEKRPGGATYDYDVMLKRSLDAGRSWQEAFLPYRDDSPGEHGFVSFAPLDARRMGILFLDGRETKRPDGAMTLRFAAAAREGEPEPDVLVDPRVCDCCQTALARTARGLVAAYRDRSPGEVRDVAVARFEDGRWTAPVFPSADGWEIHACPVNGPALAADGDTVALAWFTMAGDEPRVKLAFSQDGGASWGPAQVVDDGRPIGRVDVVLRGPDREAVVSWLEDDAGTASVRLRRMAPGAARSASVALAGTSLSRSSGFPRLAAVGDDLLAAWRDASEPARIRTALVELP